MLPDANLPTEALSACSAIATIQGLLPQPCPYTRGEIQAQVESFARRLAGGEVAAQWEFVLWFQTLMGTQWQALPEAIEGLRGTPLETLPHDVHKTLIDMVADDPAAEDTLAEFAQAVGRCSDGGSY